MIDERVEMIMVVEERVVIRSVEEEIQSNSASQGWVVESYYAPRGVIENFRRWSSAIYDRHIDV